MNELQQFVKDNKLKPDPSESKILSTKEDFENEIKQPGYTFVKFFAPWCGHCQKLAPKWDLLATQYSVRKDVSIAKIDCTKEETKPICKDAEVHKKLRFHEKFVKQKFFYIFHYFLGERVPNFDLVQEW